MKTPGSNHDGGVPLRDSSGIRGGAPATVPRPGGGERGARAGGEQGTRGRGNRPHVTVHPQSDFRDPVGAVSIQEKKDRNFRSFFEMAVLGAQSTDLDFQTHF